MSSLWSTNSAQTITMIAMVTMPVTTDTAPCMPVVARLAMVARRPGAGTTLRNGQVEAAGGQRDIPRVGLNEREEDTGPLLAAAR